ncbi:23S rRNA (uracil(1939)-C(5))-methyltransferase RlmD [Marinomonas spartinae]|uniref:23S rRNA (uracil(1939)-C(5))-methyltransferase RlmD n=1 Tax=Marinomonas spartinae TaxID=1792290 RepID=A0A1A8T7M2_9GAMM|nr:23S rRNA (uracil(1939)-C(5))-methyltransferase RlmD [Marinomonas spartinae]SBS28575.1 23S rRNA (uracil(1939)-C(5))-methyltransferase RlmD [Marinomonas spartinae]
MRRRHPTRRPPSPPALGPIQLFEIEGLTHDAKGVARQQGKVTFISGALPGETVEAQVSKAGRRFDEASLNQVIHHSPDRVTPACPHFFQCGGCSFQHLAQEKQLDAKYDWLKGQIRKVVSSDEPLSVLADQPVAYRRRARLSVQVKKQRVQLGFRGKSSNEIVSIDRCLVLTTPLQAVFESLKTSLAADALAKKLGHVELLEDSKGLAVTFRLIQALDDSLKAQWESWAQQQQVALYWQQPEMKRAEVDGNRRFYQLDDLRLHYHPQDFIQVNAAMNEKMVKQAMNWLEPCEQDTILDLFCGVGNFSLPLAKRAKQVVGVELQEEMVAVAGENAAANHLDNAHFVAADLTKPVSRELSNIAFTKVLLDPPRAGAFEFLEAIINMRPKQILYVSCSASTLARDAEYLVTKGYRVLRAGLMDMFPQTSHVETMMLLQKK